jgi:cellulose synthase/poly-beta-1,6-N-acetylglucosamine synthase-like glycosyltransferase
MGEYMVSVLIPSYKIDPYIEIVESALKGINHEIIVQYDIAGEGKGITLQRAFERAKGDLIVWLDADMQLSPSYIPLMIKIMEDTNSGVVITSKRHRQSEVNVSTTRRLLSYCTHVFIGLLFDLPLTDTQAGLKLFRREILTNQWHLKGFGYDVEVLWSAYKRGYKITEIPIKITGSSVNFNSVVKTFKEILWLRMMK